MSKYTTEVRFICETYAGYTESQDYSMIDTVIEKAREKVFDFDFPIFDEDYRSVLETKILKHYYTREIGLETAALWKHFLATKLNEVMPYYNQLYKSAQLEFDPFNDVDYTRQGQRKLDEDESTTATSTGTQTGATSDTHSGTQWNTYSDTPQGALNGVSTENYLTNARKITDSENDSGTSSTNTQSNGSGTRALDNTEDYLEHIFGKMNGSVNYSDALLKYRNTFINIDLMIIDSLSDLFLNLW